MPRRTRLARHARQNAVAYLALFVALGGTSAYAANTIGSEDIIDESILTQDIRNGQVTRGDIAANAVNSSRVADGALTGADIADGTVTGADVNESRLARVPTADRAPLEDHVIVEDVEDSGLSPTYPDVVIAVAVCPEGTKPVGAGLNFLSFAQSSSIIFFPLAHAVKINTYAAGVEVAVRLNPGSDASWNGRVLRVIARAICGRVVPRAG